MDARIFQQQEVNYRHIQDTVLMMPAAVRAVDADAKPDVLKALNAITTAVTGANKNLFFAVAEVNGVTAGFIGGALANFVFEDRTFAQDILMYVAPEHRSTSAARALSKAFAEWGFSMGAAEVRGYLMNSENADSMAAASERQGYKAIGRIIVLKRGE